MSDHLMRKATAADFDDVMAIGDVYKGTDYLRNKYHLFMVDPNAKPYVYVIGNDIVCFCCTFIVDDGLTLLTRGSRIKPGYQGQGIYGKLIKKVYDEYRGIPGLKYEAFTTNNLNLDSQKGLPSYYIELTRKKFLSYKFKLEELDLPSVNQDDHVEEMTSSDVTSLFTSGETPDETLFPGGKIVVDWVPVRFCESNLKYIYNADTVALKSKNGNSQVSLMSFGIPVPCELGVRYAVDMFGKDAARVMDHMLRLLKKLHTSDVIILQIATDLAIEQSVDDAVRSFGIGGLGGFTMDMLFNYEREFK